MNTCTELTCPHHGEENRAAADAAIREQQRKAVEDSVTLWDHFSATINLRIAEMQPQYNLVQLNARREASNEMISCDINRDDFLAAVAKVLRVEITPLAETPQNGTETALGATQQEGRE